LPSPESPSELISVRLRTNLSMIHKAQKERKGLGSSFARPHEAEPMNSHSQPDDDKKRVMDLLRVYGKEFLVFDLHDQPNVFTEAEVRFPPARSGKVNPKQMKNWRHLPRMLQLLRDQYGLFRTGRLITDCPLFILKPRKGDDPKEFRKAFQVIVAKGLIWFRCRRAIFCGRKHCLAQNKGQLDIYDLICWLDGKGDLNHARKVVAEYFDVELANFPKPLGSSAQRKRTGDEKADWLRYAVPKEALERLFRLPHSGPSASDRFVSKAVEIITGAPQVPYDGHNADTGGAILFSRSFPWEIKLKEFGPASRLFIWLHWKQAEEKRRLELTYDEVAKALRIQPITLKEYARRLVKAGYVEVSQEDKNKNYWSAKYLSDAGQT
jgi:hypothetical protein